MNRYKFVIIYINTLFEQEMYYLNSLDHLNISRAQKSRIFYGLSVLIEYELMNNGITKEQYQFLRQKLESFLNYSKYHYPKF